MESSLKLIWMPQININNKPSTNIIKRSLDLKLWPFTHRQVEIYELNSLKTESTFNKNNFKPSNYFEFNL